MIQKFRLFNAISCITQLIILAFSIALFFIFDLSKLYYISVVNVSMDLVAMAVAFLLFLSCADYNYTGTKQTVNFMILVEIEFFSMFFDICFWFIDGHAKLRIFNYIVNYFYWANQFIVYSFFYFYVTEIFKLKNKVLNTIVYTFSVVIVLILLGNIFGHYCFTIDSHGKYLRTHSSFYITQIYGLLIFFILLYVVVTNKASRTLKICLYSFLILPYASVIIQAFCYGIGLQHIVTLLVYMTLYVENFVARARKISQQQHELSEARTQIMMSQIQPHFLYNTLTTIHCLCSSNPKLAASTIENFSHYLRTNINSIDVHFPIPFEKEIDHTKEYVAIELLRFDNISVKYELNDMDFMIPSLSVQPLVENSIKHGVRSKEKGLILIKSYKMNKEHYIIIEDNGCGFDVKSVLDKSDNNHVGIKNVSSRLKTMVNGSINIVSSHEKGTTITIIIPEEENF